MEYDITLILAIWGAFLSTCLAVIQLYRLFIEQREKKPKIKVKISVPTVIKMGSRVEKGILLGAMNVGSKAVTLSSVPSLLLPSEKQFVIFNSIIPVNFPYELLPGKSCQVFIEIREFVQTLKELGYSGKIKIVGQFGDAIGNSYKSEPFDFNIDFWAK